MAKVITGTGTIADADYKYIRWTGQTKSGKAVSIELPVAICLSNPDWTFAEKDDIVPEVEFSAVYDDEKLAAGDRTEPWTLTVEDGVKAGNGEIVLGAGKFYLGTTKATAKLVGLSRGGGKFTVERDYREINADDDPGPVKDRIVLQGGRPKLSVKALQWLTKVTDLYSGMKETTAT